MSVLMLAVGLLFLLSSLACVAGWIWLVVRGFKTGVGWGIAMLLVPPIAAIVAAVKDWQNWKQPFLLYWGSGAVQVALAVMVVVAMPFASPFAGSTDAQAQLDLDLHQAQQASTASLPEAESAGKPDSDDSATTPGAASLEPVAEPTVDSGAVYAEAASAKARAANTTTLVDPAGQPAAASIPERGARSASGRLAGDPTFEVPEGFEEITVAAAASHAGSKVRIFDVNGKLHRGTLKGVENGTLIVSFDWGAGSLVTGFEPKEIRSLQVAR